jgi:hypothetical protein
VRNARDRLGGSRLRGRTLVEHCFAFGCVHGRSSNIERAGYALPREFLNETSESRRMTEFARIRGLSRFAWSQLPIVLRLRDVANALRSEQQIESTQDVY